MLLRISKLVSKKNHDPPDRDFFNEWFSDYMFFI